MGLRLGLSVGFGFSLEILVVSLEEIRNIRSGFEC